jgi:hypothetical protein
MQGAEIARIDEVDSRVFFFAGSFPEKFKWLIPTVIWRGRVGRDSGGDDIG